MLRLKRVRRGKHPNSESSGLLALEHALSKRKEPVLASQHWVRPATWRCLLAILVVTSWASAQTLAAQVQTGPSAPPLPSAGTQQNPFLGGVPSGAPVPGVFKLSLSDAIQRGLRFNLAKLSLARAPGVAESAAMQYLGGTR